ncbi:MAG: hypothetical protein OXC18_02905 [Desulfurellaceae bacterium]|nr:hypothetical protein [Desulfurellaceae bacterium]
MDEVQKEFIKIELKDIRAKLEVAEGEINAGLWRDLQVSAYKIQTTAKGIEKMLRKLSATNERED